MKSDIDALMQAYELEALLITGPGQHNPAMVYLTGGAHMTQATLVKKRGEAPVLYCRSMERDEAARTGLITRNLEDEAYNLVFKKYQGDPHKVTVDLYQRILTQHGITSGRVGISGIGDVGNAFALFSAVQAAMPGLSLIGDLGSTILSEAMQTKEMQEIERIRRVGQVTTTVVGQVADWLTSLQAKDEVLVKPDGQPLTIGEVKSKIDLWLAENGMANPEGTIFAIGRDSAIPHSTGLESDVLRLGQTIVFDIFPCEAHGGYFHDFTRTWCLGYAPDQVWAVYEDVREVFDQVLVELKLGSPCKLYQELTCELFEARGHPTIRTNPQTTDGYVHGLGHGLGLQIHQKPFYRLISSQDDRLLPNVITTIEPGLYYPERNIGVRLEDTIWMRPDGAVEVLAQFPYDLVLPVKR